MKLELRGDMRMEQRMKLAPHMIQSMEILQLPILALQERIEQELNSNPVLEMVEQGELEEPARAEEPTDDIEQKDLVINTDNNKLEDFERLESIRDDFDNYLEQAGPFRRRIDAGERDRKLEALKNAAAPPQSLHDYLSEQWGLIEADEPVKKAGQAIIDYINDRGYLSVRLEQLHNKDRNDFTVEDLHQALELVQRLEPAGVGARDLRECLLIQLSQRTEKDMSFEKRLVSEHFDELLENRLPDIARKMNCSIETVKKAVEQISKLDTSPGLQIARERNYPISPDVIVEPTNDDSGCSVRLADANLPRLRINKYYAKMTKDDKVGEKTRKFLQSNILSARWIIDAVEQRNNTLLKVTESVVKHQKDFFDKGPLCLRPLPMSRVAKDVGVHLATVSRAVSGKYMQSPWGILPLRKFFSGGMEDADGEGLSWEAIRAKLQQIIDNEDKAKPLSDDQIRERLAEAGIKDIARRTVAKYRKLLNIPAARYRKKY